MNKRLRYIAKAFGILTLCLGVGFVIESWIFAGQFVAPDPGRVTWPKKLSFAPREVTFQASDGINLKGWFLEQTNSIRAVVLLHGISANRYQMLDRAIWLRTLGYNVLLYDSRGCGESAAAAHSFGYHETRDLLGAVDWLQSQGLIQIGCVGFSQGAATILLASGQLPPSVRGVVAEAPYATLQASVDDHFRNLTGYSSCFLGALIVPFAEWKLGMSIEDVSPLREIAKLKAPVFLIGGTSDDLAPPKGIHELYVAARGEKELWMVSWAGHADFFSYAEAEYKRRVGDFLGRHL